MDNLYFNIVNKNKIIILFSIVIFAILYSQYNNENLYFYLLISSNEKKIDNFAFKRILEISKKKDIVRNLLEKLEKDENPDKKALYILTLGVIGDNQASHTLISFYINCQNQYYLPHCRTIQNYSVVALGLLGNIENKVFLSKTFETLDYQKTNVSAQTFAESLYLLTGEKIKYNYKGINREFIPWKSYIEAREVIKKSKNKVRSINQMMILFNAIM